MNTGERRETAKIYQFPQRRPGDSSRFRPEGRIGGEQIVRSPAIVWDGWYHDAAIAEERPGKP